MAHTQKLVECANCGRPVREADAEDLGWRYWSDGKDLHLICAHCAYREFQVDAPASVLGSGSVTDAEARQPRRPPLGPLRVLCRKCNSHRGAAALR
jgi:DNA-directed RNA polymerase subunit RPC12/RpoP